MWNLSVLRYDMPILGGLFCSFDHDFRNNSSQISQAGYYTRENYLTIILIILDAKSYSDLLKY